MPKGKRRWVLTGGDRLERRLGYWGARFLIRASWRPVVSDTRRACAMMEVFSFTVERFDARMPVDTAINRLALDATWMRGPRPGVEEAGVLREIEVVLRRKHEFPFTER